MSEEIGKRIKTARETHHWSQAKLARIIGVNSLTVLRWEHGRSIPHYERQQELIKHIGMRQEDFSREKQQPASPSPIQPKESEQAQLISPPVIQLGEVQQEQSSLSLPTQGDESERAEFTPSQTAQPVESGPEQEQPPSFLQLILPPKDEIKIYQGRRIIRHTGNGAITRHPYVMVNGSPLRYFGPGRRDPVESIVFEWGYLGEGPRMLAEAILADFFTEDYPEHGVARTRDYNALLYGSLFKEEFIGTLPLHFKDDQDDDWEITSDQIRGWFNSLEEKGITREALLKSAYGEKYYMRD